MHLEDWSSCLRVLADPTRVRLLALLEREELTVAELAAITHLAQPRVSTHLAKLKEAGLVRDRRAGVSAYYRSGDDLDPAQAALWQALREGTDDPLLRQDAERLPSVLALRAAEQNWADAVAGDMERHYSPGRTWETMARATLPLLVSGDVIDVASGDGALAELLAPHAHSYVCVDASERVAAAARQRLKPHKNARVQVGDMHALALPDASFDLALLMQALAYSQRPGVALAEAARVLRPGGRLVVTAIARHEHREVVAPYGHANLGFTGRELARLAEKAKLRVLSCAPVMREKRPPHFEVLVLHAVKA
ncbi:MAG: metalloregulator ArsR/SmtB family transcription factor [Proteobacteria bacterium]|nr:metalloregulator ArsR/SmtB family transcription factor [Pseudomonadota bacterium]MBS0463796.1 metalloregulator ArsR/SmtB family transcription factor [Pseudomonadota bacterium]